ncbi:hypothetical protein HMPREF1544_12316 [Mucor circinelloides 1006PhL]|uniref:Uncharacterized protein n=1 Tax=Mucor circinelloides f. circinelloides (strain 1006PhL) TaxID=1220926 RepID=S2JMJ3_MUCC1|nr:hypothetical protein HMPREF1544_12316 [Mucor circinelloides 1006PhL]
MDLNLNNMDISQIATVLQQFQHQLTAVQEKVQHHDNLLARLDMLEKENEDLKKNLLDRDLVIKNLQSQLSVTGTTAPTPAPAKTGTSTATPNQPVTAPSYASAAKKGKSRPDPATTTKRRLAAGRLFQNTASKSPQGYQYVYLGRSKKIQRSEEVRSALRKSGVDLGR